MFSRKPFIIFLFLIVSGCSDHNIELGSRSNKEPKNDSWKKVTDFSSSIEPTWAGYFPNNKALGLTFWFWNFDALDEDGDPTLRGITIFVYDKGNHKFRVSSQFKIGFDAKFICSDSKCGTVNIELEKKSGSLPGT